MTTLGSQAPATGTLFVAPRAKVGATGGAKMVAKRQRKPRPKTGAKRRAATGLPGTPSPPPSPPPAQGATAPTVASLSPPAEGDTVRVSGALCRVLFGWPGMMERIRYRQAELLPLAHASGVEAARLAVEDALRNWYENARSERSPFRASGVLVPRWLLETFQEWLPTLRRARTGQMGMSVDEQAGLEVAALALPVLLLGETA